MLYKNVLHCALFSLSLSLSPNRPSKLFLVYSDGIFDTTKQETKELFLVYLDGIFNTQQTKKKKRTCEKLHGIPFYRRVRLFHISSEIFHFLGGGWDFLFLFFSFIFSRKEITRCQEVPWKVKNHTSRRACFSPFFFGLFLAFFFLPFPF